MKNAKAQVTSLDIIISIIILLVLLGIITVILTMIVESSASREYYGGELFAKVEGLDDSIAFLSDHKVDEAKLASFSHLDYESRIKPLMLSDSERFNTIEDDVCIFFTSGNDILAFDGMDSVGMALQPDGSKGLCNPADPCRNYRESFAYSKPVLKESGPAEKKIAKMNIVVCVK